MFFIKRPFPRYFAFSAAACLQRVFVAAVLLCGFLFGPNAGAQQKDTAQKEPVYVNANTLISTKTDSGELTKFIGKAVFIQGTDTLYCDSLYKHAVTNIYEAFGDVRIAQQGGTQGTSNYLRYTAGNKEAFMTGNVILTDGKNRLQCEELTYNLGTKTGVYNKGGTLYSDSTTVSSNTGIYNVTSKESRFKGNVHIADPQYKINSEDVGYNTETKFETFYAHSIVVSDSGREILETSNGTYDSKKGIAHFLDHPKIWDDGQYIEADTLNYNKGTGYGLGIGHVISIDTAHHSKLFCGRLEYYQKKRVLWATIKPVMEQVNGKDTIYMRADTFYSAPMVKIKPVPHKLKAKKDTAAAAIDSAGGKVIRDSAAKIADTAQNKSIGPAAGKVADTASGKLVTTPGESADTMQTKIIKHAAKKTADTVNVWVHDHHDKTRDTIKITTTPGYKIPGSEDTIVSAKGKKPKRKKDIVPGDGIAVDTAAADSTAPLYFIGYHHVKIFSDSLQGKCDSVCYTRSDSTIRMMYAPITWAHNSQINGDTILIHLDTNEVRSMYVPNNAFVVSRSGPVKAQLFDQVQGKTLTAYFMHNTITNAIVFPNAETIYFPVDEEGAYLGMNQSKGERMRIYFDDQKIEKFKVEQDADIILTPMEKVDFPNAHLSRFKWLIDLRPKSKEELFK